MRWHENTDMSYDYSWVIHVWLTVHRICHMKARVGDAESVRSASETAPRVGGVRAVETQLHRFGAARWPCPEREWGHHGEAGRLGAGCEHPGRSWEPAGPTAEPPWRPPTVRFVGSGRSCHTMSGTRQLRDDVGPKYTCVSESENKTVSSRDL